MVELVFDGLMAIGITGAMVYLLKSQSFIQTAVLFIAFGLLMAIVWVRLWAPDIALAEAAIGTGITSVLLIDALRHTEWLQSVLKPAHKSTQDKRLFTNLLWKYLVSLLSTTLLVALILATFKISDPKPEIAQIISRKMTDLDNPVTEVLLIYRSFDTMLELGILLLAVLGMIAVRGKSGIASLSLTPPKDSILDSTVKLLVPLMILIAGYLLWLGTFAAGGAFQAGVILGAVGILLWLSGHWSLKRTPAWLWQSLVLLGFAVFLLSAVLSLLWADWLMQYPSDYRKPMVQIIEFSAAISIGTTFAAMFVGLHPPRQSFSFGGSQK